jgi:hypothetical protein
MLLVFIDYIEISSVLNVYFKLIECLYGVMLKKNFYHFLKFYNMFKEDIFYIKDHRCLNTLS